MAFNFTFILQFPFRRSIHSHDVSSLPKYFCFTYWYPFRINFLAPVSVKLNSTIASFNYINQTWERLKNFMKKRDASTSYFICRHFKRKIGGTDQLHWNVTQKQPLRRILKKSYYTPVLKILRSIFQEVCF